MKTKSILKIGLVALTILITTISMHQIMAQETKPPMPKDKSLLDKFNDGGPWMYPILLTSIVAVGVGIFCAIKIRRPVLMPPDLLASLRNCVIQHQVDEGYKLCQGNDSALAKVTGAALGKASFEREMYNKAAMESAAAEAFVHQETRLMTMVNYLNVCAQIAPMLGLFGTVVGMIEAFDNLAAGRSEPADLANGIGVAMLTTAGGLIVAIPAMAAYFYFRGQLVNIMADMQKAVSNMLDIFTREITPEGERPGAEMVSFTETPLSEPTA